MSVAAVVLAAGFSRRLGRPKQDVSFGGEMLLERAVRTASAAGLSPVIAVVREARCAGVLEPGGAHVVLNDEAGEGMASSVRRGLAALGQADVRGVIIMTCDQPLLRVEHLRTLCAEPARVTGSAYAGRVGVPAFFPAATFPALMALQGDQGARELLRGAEAIADEDLALDIDTEDDLRRAESRFALG